MDSLKTFSLEQMVMKFFYMVEICEEESILCGQYTLLLAKLGWNLKVTAFEKKIHLPNFHVLRS